MEGGRSAPAKSHHDRGDGRAGAVSEMIDPIHLRTYVIRPVLKDLGLWSEPAEKLILGTACQESQCGRWLRQIGEGPALGIFQMEPATHNDLWNNFLDHRPEIARKVKLFVAGLAPSAEQLVGNLYYATAMCRIHYLRVPEPIPNTLEEQAAYWKKFYNSELGKGKVE